MSHIDNVFIQVRAELQARSIKLWLPPYYYEEVGSIESELMELAGNFSRSLHITQSKCKCALVELQDGALRKLAARKEYEETGLATLIVRRIDTREGTQNVLEVKCSLTDLGVDLQAHIANRLKIDDMNQVKCISAGKIVVANKTLREQGLKNNQQLMVIVGQMDRAEQNNSDQMYDRIRKIKLDVESIVDSERHMFEMEDQDGNPVFLPPEENRALLIAMGYCEKARVAMKGGRYDEALVLLLEADEMFNSCNSKFLESVDNYALVNLDIVWCYLCLKNIAQLPDADRRLNICERSFRRSYGENYSRLYALKGNACPERALIMRLHLLQGIIYFHQNRRNDAFELFELATRELHELQANDTMVGTLVEMGYEPADARLGLRACSGNLEEAINFIHERKEKLQMARKQSEKERHLNKTLTKIMDNDNDWVNPRSVCTLMDMGFPRDLVVQALKETKNNVPKALDLMQSEPDRLISKMQPIQDADERLLTQLKQFGFNDDMARTALEMTQNNVERAIEYLLKFLGGENELLKTLEKLTNAEEEQSSASPSTSQGPLDAKVTSTAMQKIKDELESIKAYKRFNEDITDTEQDYLDLMLCEEEKYLVEYKNLLEM